MTQITIAYSSCVKAIEYFPDTQKLVVTWNTHAAYEYDNVPESIYLECATAAQMRDSVGSLLKSRLKQGNYAYRKLN